jgi:hypothetical protein
MRKHVRFASLILMGALITAPMAAWAQAGPGSSSGGAGAPGASGSGASSGPGGAAGSGTGTGPGAPGSGSDASAPSTAPGATPGASGVSGKDQGTTQRPAVGGATNPSASPTMSGDYMGRHTMNGTSDTDRSQDRHVLAEDQRGHAPAARARLLTGERQARGPDVGRDRGEAGKLNPRKCAHARRVVRWA